MLLTKHELEEMKDVISGLKGKWMNKKTFNKLMDIANSVGYEVSIVDEGPLGITNFDDKSININYDRIDDASRVEAKSVADSSGGKLKFLDLYDRTFVRTLLHELSHHEQMSGYDDPVLDDYYKTVIELCRNRQVHWENLMWSKLSYEHHADANALRLMTDVYDPEIFGGFWNFISDEYCYLLLQGYKNLPFVGMRSVTDSTMKILGCKKHFDFSDLDLKTRLLHGFPISKEELKEVKKISFEDDFIKKLG